MYLIKILLPSHPPAIVGYEEVEKQQNCTAATKLNEANTNNKKKMANPRNEYKKDEKEEGPNLLPLSSFPFIF